MPTLTRYDARKCRQFELFVSCTIIVHCRDHVRDYASPKWQLLDPHADPPIIHLKRTAKRKQTNICEQIPNALLFRTTTILTPNSKITGIALIPAERSYDIMDREMLASRRILLCIRKVDKIGRELQIYLRTCARTGFRSLSRYRSGSLPVHVSMRMALLYIRRAPKGHVGS